LFEKGKGKGKGNVLLDIKKQTWEETEGNKLVSRNRWINGSLDGKRGRNIPSSR
jgi:hypothetical protein